MNDGNVNLSGNSFTIGTSAASTGTLSHAGASTNGWVWWRSDSVHGNCRNGHWWSGSKWTAPPIGKCRRLEAIYIGKTNIRSGGRITVSHTNSTSTNTVNIADTNPMPPLRDDHNSFWTVSTSGISAGTWALRAGGTNFGVIANASHLRMSTSASVVGINSAGSGGRIGV